MNPILNRETHSTFISIAHSHFVIRNKTFRSGRDGERGASEVPTLYSQLGFQGCTGGRGPLPFLTPFGPVNPMRSDAQEFNREARWYLQLETETGSWAGAPGRGRARPRRPGGERAGGRLYLHRSSPNGLYLALGRRGRGYLQEESSMA